jgi:hypothetical protein
MKIGLDFHGVINSLPIFFTEMSKLFISAGHEVHIITGKELTDEFIKEIDNIGIKYTHLFSIITHCKENGYKTSYIEEENPYIDTEIWNRVKSSYCLMNKIDIMIDDSDIYSDYFATPYIQVKIKNKEII